MAQNAEPVWIETELALAIHDRQLAEHGGPMGLRDAAGLESALARARHQWSYGETDLCQLAAAYAYGLARNHPFTDGNKRTAWVLARLFLALNDVRIVFAPEDAVRAMLALAAGTLDEADLADWFRERLLADSGAGL
ncbi:type II toxin-antitoxin system death-on-curing family toxin [Novosphingobium pokkalii]|uniref:Type II toxin-antitoxin system death-on-curing family toxin n=1 Tax=Novosphingobium pokkalii TaxID=1770194 RepID=A0ABV7UZT5_9SPHN|nr:type II toxin-antitoxin system death-on-curing family toxin [Novosphingobium pokkalii]GHC86110.1 death-on-curing protein [Novosphingobium pokkalii]